jgi:hypothetical protein
MGMPIAPSTSALGAIFNPFLFASVIGDAEPPLNVVSVLARLDVDPWEEAAKLSSLRGEVAADRLASLLARCPAVVLPGPDLGMLAQRLVALLPTPLAAQARSRDNRIGAQIGLDPRFIIVAALIFQIAAFATLARSGAHEPRDLAVAQHMAQSTPLPSVAAPSPVK